MKKILPVVLLLASTVAATAKGGIGFDYLCPHSLFDVPVDTLALGGWSYGIVLTGVAALMVALGALGVLAPRTRYSFLNGVFIAAVILTVLYVTVYGVTTVVHLNGCLRNDWEVLGVWAGLLVFLSPAAAVTSAILVSLRLP